MQSVLVTGANKGIGLAVVEATLHEQPDKRVLLGSRNVDRGEKARQALLELDAGFGDRLDVVELDVSHDASVERAAERVRASGVRLHGIVNNAGVLSGRIADVLDVNVHGIRRVCDAFASLVVPGGRIVNVTSAAGPNFVARCDADRQAFFTDDAIEGSALEAFMDRTAAHGDLTADGMGGGSAYGFSKACANGLTLWLARQHPGLVVNACTPGYIDTDLGRETLSSQTPEQAGMKQPADGARVIMKLLFDPPRGTGRYYGSDGLRSPLDRYRAPGSPEFEGSNRSQT